MIRHFFPFFILSLPFNLLPLVRSARGPGGAVPIRKLFHFAVNGNRARLGRHFFNRLSGYATGALFAMRARVRDGQLDENRARAALSDSRGRFSLFARSFATLFSVSNFAISLRARIDFAETKGNQL